VRVPQSVGQWDDTGYPDSSLPADFNTYKDNDPLLAIPPWMADAWVLLDRDEVVRASLYAYYEALGLEIDHPSAAFLVYVAAIEGIGARLSDLTRCDCCEKCEVETGAQRRFHKALKTVMSNKEVKRLASRSGRYVKPAAPSSPRLSVPLPSGADRSSDATGDTGQLPPLSAAVVSLG
jgi:hypothetical protein